MIRTTLLLIGTSFLTLLSCGGTRAPDPGETARMYGARASEQFAEGNLLGARAGYEKAYAVAAQADLPREQAKYLFNIGRVWYELGSLDSAEAAFLTAYRDFTYYHDAEGGASAAGFIALVNALAGKHDSAFAWYGRGRPEKLSGNAQTAFWLSVQAQLCIAKDRIPEAQGYLDKAMECAKKDKMFGSMAHIEFCRAGIAYTAANYAEARVSLGESLAKIDKAPERYRRWRVLFAYATVSFCLHDEEAGVRYYTRAVDCAPKGIAVPVIDSARTCSRQGWIR
jgi:tetratricopeptide (TPR) repeat protein